MSTFPERLRSLREARGLPCATLSELCGLYEHAFRRYERGEAIPSAEVLCIIADEFGVSMDYLWGRSEK